MKRLKSIRPICATLLAIPLASCGFLKSEEDSHTEEVIVYSEGGAVERMLVPVEDFPVDVDEDENEDGGPFGVIGSIKNRISGIVDEVVSYKNSILSAPSQAVDKFKDILGNSTESISDLAESVSNTVSDKFDAISAMANKQAEEMEEIRYGEEQAPVEEAAPVVEEYSEESVAVSVYSSTFLNGNSKINYNPNNLIDGTSAIWAATYTGSPLYLDFFVNATKISKIIIKNGYLKNADAYNYNSRMKQISVYVDGNKVGTYTLNNNSYSASTDDVITFDSPIATNGTVSIEVESIYEGRKWKDVCVEEITIIGNPRVKSLKDPRDGKEYRIAAAANQIWMAQNLNYATSNSYCYNDTEDYCTNYGRLYTWNDAMQVCPEGWHLPSDSEWENITAASQYSLELATAGGFRNSKGSYELIGSRADMWTSTEESDTQAKYRYYSVSKGSLSTNKYSKSGAMSVRCVMDDPAFTAYVSRIYQQLEADNLLAEQEAAARQDSINAEMARQDSINAAEQARQDSIEAQREAMIAAQQAYRDSVKAENKARQDSIRAAKKARQDSLAALRETARAEEQEAPVAKSDKSEAKVLISTEKNISISNSAYSKAQVIAKLRQKKAGFKKVYQDLLDTRSSFETTIAVQLTVGASGSVTNVQDVSSDDEMNVSGHTLLFRRLGGTLRTMKFSAEGEETIITFSIKFIVEE